MAVEERGLEKEGAADHIHHILTSSFARNETDFDPASPHLPVNPSLTFPKNRPKPSFYGLATILLPHLHDPTPHNQRQYPPPHSVLQSRFPPNMLAILLACLMLVAVPIMAVQYPRFYPPLHSGAERNLADPGLDGTGEKTPTTSRNTEAGIQMKPPRAAATWEDAPRGMSWDGMERQKTGDLKRVEAMQIGDEKAVTNLKKPWDPPFATSPKSGRETYRILGRSASPVMDEKGNRQMATETTQDEMNSIIESRGQHLPCTEPVADSPPPLPTASYHLSSSTAKTNAHPAPESFPRDRSSRPSVFQIIAFLATFLIFIFAFAVLTAHCLAWFIVYKTESRLGEVRQGLLRGGDMRVCLCAHG
jgi:hypothetical protein